MIFKDQLNRKVFIQNQPQRIISLVPSHTELLYDLGLEDQVVGVTRFCIFPERAMKDNIIIGGTKNLKLNRIRSLNPDFIIADKEENTKEQIEELAKEFPVWISNIRHQHDALEMIEQVGLITGCQLLAENLIGNIKLAFAKLEPKKSNKTVAYFIWQKPLMVAARDTFIDEMILKIGLKNVFAEKQRYPIISDEFLQETNPNIILLSSEPYPFKEKHIAYFQNLVPEAQILLVDGTYFSWYGSRLLKASNYFRSLLPLLD